MIILLTSCFSEISNESFYSLGIQVQNPHYAVGETIIVYELWLLIIILLTSCFSDYLLQFSKVHFKALIYLKVEIPPYATEETV